MAGCIRQCTRIGVFDTVSQFNFPGEPRRNLPGFDVFHEPGPLKQYLRARLNSSFRFVYQPKAGDRTSHFEAVNALVIAAGHMIYAVDEVDAHMTASYAPPRFYDLVNYGRHYAVSMILSARRPAQVAREVTAAAQEFRLFRMTERGDVNYFRDLCGESVAQQLPQLSAYQYVLWHDDGTAAKICGGRR